MKQKAKATNQLSVRVNAATLKALQKFVRETEYDFSKSTGLRSSISLAKACRMLIEAGLRKRGYLREE